MRRESVITDARNHWQPGFGPRCRPADQVDMVHMDLLQVRQNS